MDNREQTDKAILDELKIRADVARNFPDNTCAASRHAEMIARKMVEKGGYPMLAEEPEHCAISILSTVVSLYEARTKLATVDEWVSVAERLPEPSEKLVEMCNVEAGYHQICNAATFLVANALGKDRPTHWRYARALPTPPKGE